MTTDKNGSAGERAGRQYLGTTWSMNMVVGDATVEFRKGGGGVPVKECISLVQTEPRAALLTAVLGQRVTVGKAPVRLVAGDTMWVVQVLGPDGRVYKPDTVEDVRRLDLSALRLQITRVRVVA